MDCECDEMENASDGCVASCARGAHLVHHLGSEGRTETRHFRVVHAQARRRRLSRDCCSAAAPPAILGESSSDPCTTSTKHRRFCRRFCRRFGFRRDMLQAMILPQARRDLWLGRCCTDCCRLRITLGVRGVTQTSGCENVSDTRSRVHDIDAVQ